MEEAEPTFWGRVRYALRALLGTYILGVAVYLVLRLIFRQSVVMSYLDGFVHLLVIPPLIALPLLLLRREWQLSALVAPSLLAFLIWYVPPFIPQDASPAPIEAPTLSILTFNIKIESHQIPAIAAIIREADTDVVIVQEMSAETADYFDTEMTDRYPEQALHRREPFYFGMGTLSRFPILADEYWEMGLGIQRVELDFNGTTVTLYNLHATPPTFVNGVARRNEDIQYVLEQAERETNPVILAGDFNITSRVWPYPLIVEAYTDSFAEAGYGLGFTFIPPLGLGPLMRFDYVFHDDHFRTIEARVWPEHDGADHRPLRARLALMSRQAE